MSQFNWKCPLFKWIMRSEFDSQQWIVWFIILMKDLMLSLCIYLFCALFLFFFQYIHNTHTKINLEIGYFVDYNFKMVEQIIEVHHKIITMVHQVMIKVHQIIEDHHKMQMVETIMMIMNHINLMIIIHHINLIIINHLAMVIVVIMI